MEKKIILNIQDCGSDFIYHWFILMLGSLRRIPNILKELNSNDPSILNLKPPYYITFLGKDNLSNFQKESLDLISSNYIFVPKDKINKNDIIINTYGEPVNDYGCLNDPDLYYFIKNLFLNNNIKINSNKFKNKKYFISRKKSHLLDGNKGVKRRHILNEEELKKALSNFNIEFIDLEDYETLDKIKLFSNADTIISPNSGGLTFSLFAGEKTKIIEINPLNAHMVKHLYQCMCYECNIPYYRFHSDGVDDLDNMTVNIDKFINFLIDNKII